MNVVAWIWREMGNILGEDIVEKATMVCCGGCM